MLAVFWHKNPDTDTICSAIVYSTYLSDTGKAAKAYALGKPNMETARVLNYWQLSAPESISTLPEWTRIVLMDHNEAGQSIDGRDQLVIDSVIDHHNLGSISTWYPLMMRFEPVWCTCTILHHMFTDAGYTPSKVMAWLMISSILSDTLHFRSTTTTQYDKDAVEALNRIAQIPDLWSYASEMFDAKWNLGDMPIDEILKLDYKTFDMSGKKVWCGVMETTNPAYGFARKDELLAGLSAMKEKDGLDYILFSIIDIIKEENYALVIGDDEKTVIQGAFGAAVQDHLAPLGRRISRKKQMIPELEAYFQKG